MDRLSRIDMLIKLLEKEPEDIFLNYVLGIELVAEIDLSGAETQFKKVIAIENNYIPAYYQLGKLFESQLKKDEALRFYQQGLVFAKEKKDHKTVNEFEEAIFLLED